MKANEKTRRSVTLTNAYFDAMKRLIEQGVYLVNGDVIRDSLRRLFQFHGIEPFGEHVVESEARED